MRHKKRNPKKQNAWLFLLCVLLCIILGSLYLVTARRDAAQASELKKAAEEQIEIESEQGISTWQMTDDQTGDEETE